MKITTPLILAMLTLGTNASAHAEDILITAAADYHDAAIISENIRFECTDLGSHFSQSAKRYIEEKDSGWQVSLSDNPEAQTAATAIKLKIMNAVSAGHAFIGHRKSVTVSATLYRNGKAVDTFSGTRDSMGGFMGGFKGSCDVLYRCVDTLGNDVADWLSLRSRQLDLKP